MNRGTPTRNAAPRAPSTSDHPGRTRRRRATQYRELGIQSGLHNVVLRMTVSDYQKFNLHCMIGGAPVVLRAQYENSERQIRLEPTAGLDVTIKSPGERPLPVFVVHTVEELQEAVLASAGA